MVYISLLIPSNIQYVEKIKLISAIFNLFSYNLYEKLVNMIY